MDAINNIYICLIHLKKDAKVIPYKYA